MNVVEKIKQSRMHNKLPILILFANCFYLDLFGLILGFLRVYDIIVGLSCFISIILFGIYIIFYFRRKKFTVMLFIAVVLRCVESVLFIIGALINYERNVDSIGYIPSLMSNIVSLIGYCLLAYCVFCGFKKKKLLVVSLVIAFIANLINCIFNLVSGSWYYSLSVPSVSKDILFVLLVVIFGLTNSIYPVIIKEEEYDYITFMLNDLDYKLKEGVITEEECKKFKKEIIDSL